MKKHKQHLSIEHTHSLEKWISNKIRNARTLDMCRAVEMFELLLWIRSQGMQIVCVETKIQWTPDFKKGVPVCQGRTIHVSSHDARAATRHVPQHHTFITPCMWREAGQITLHPTPRAERTRPTMSNPDAWWGRWGIWVCRTRCGERMLIFLLSMV